MLVMNELNFLLQALDEKLFNPQDKTKVFLVTYRGKECEEIDI